MAQQADALDPEENNSFSESQMTLMEHLIELRVRLMWIVGAIVVGALIGFTLTIPSDWVDFNLIGFVTSPYTMAGGKLQAINPTETIFAAFKIALFAGLVFAIPVIAFQIIGFIAPGLYPNEKRLLWLLLPGMLLLFTIGAAFAFYAMLPIAIDFLINLFAEQVTQEWTIGLYLTFVTRIVFWIGIAFETPLVFSFLARIGLVSGPALLRVWRQAIVVIAIIAAIITPTIDPINMSVVMAPLLLLYLVSVGMTYLLYKPREPRDFSD